MKTWHGQDPKLFNQEGLLVDASEEVWKAMQRKKVSKADLARLIGCSSAHITMCLNGTRNLTLRTLADFATALGYEVRVKLVRSSKGKGE